MRNQVEDKEVYNFNEGKESILYEKRSYNIRVTTY